MIQGIEPPKDAEGREIPLDTEALYFKDGDRTIVRSFEYWVNDGVWRVKVQTDYTHYSVSDMLLSPPDSWELLEHDATLAPRDYLKARGIEEHKDGRIATMMGDLVRRAKALAEREKRND